MENIGLTIKRWIKDDNQTWLSFWIETIILIAVILFIRFYIFQLFRVSGPSMCPTLNVFDDICKHDNPLTKKDEGRGEFIFVNEFLYNFFRTPERGEVVVFSPPNKKINYIKRVIGVPGDTVEIENGQVFLSNEKISRQKLPETYLSAKNQGHTATTKTKFVVPEGKYLLFGDNRVESLDARRCFSSFGCNTTNTPFVPLKNIKGKAQAVIWPFNKIRKLSQEFF